MPKLVHGKKKRPSNNDVKKIIKYLNKKILFIVKLTIITI